MTAPLADRIALVTGGSRDVGRQVALALGRQGASVVIAHVRDAHAADETVSLLEAMGARAAALATELNASETFDDVLAAFGDVLADWGRRDFDLLVNAAATRPTVDSESDDPSFRRLSQDLAGRLATGGQIVGLASGATRLAVGVRAAPAPLDGADVVRACDVRLTAVVSDRIEPSDGGRLAAAVTALCLPGATGITDKHRGGNADRPHKGAATSFNQGDRT